MIINVYKTAKGYGQFRRDEFPGALSEALQEYLDLAKLKSSDLLIGTLQKTPSYTSGSWANIVASAMNRQPGRKVGINTQRLSIIADFQDGGSSRHS